MYVCVCVFRDSDYYLCCFYFLLCFCAYFGGSLAFVFVSLFGFGFWFLVSFLYGFVLQVKARGGGRCSLK